MCYDSRETIHIPCVDRDSRPTGLVPAGNPSTGTLLVTMEKRANLGPRRGDAADHRRGACRPQPVRRLENARVLNCPRRRTDEPCDARTTTGGTTLQISLRSAPFLELSAPPQLITRQCVGRERPVRGPSENEFAKWNAARTHRTDAKFLAGCARHMSPASRMIIMSGETTMTVARKDRKIGARAIG